MVYVCLCRLQCRRNSMAILLKLVRSGFLDTAKIDPNLLYCKFYTCSHDPKIASRWAATLQNHAKMFLRTSTLAEFSQGGTQRVVLELVIGPDDDITEIQYLILVMLKLFTDRYQCTVLVSAGKYGEDRYTPISSQNYFRLANNLYFYRNNSGLSGCLEKIYPSFIIYREMDTKKKDVKWAHLPGKFTQDQLFGRIMPQIPITRRSYQVLISSYSQTRQETAPPGQGNVNWESLLRDLCQGYFERLLNGAFQNQISKIRMYQNSDSYFETLLFLGICNYISTSKEKGDKDCLDVESLHEDCMNFAQGVLQLVENVVQHVLGENESCGCGILTIRYRKMGDAQKRYIKHDASASTAKYFMELYLTDLQYGEFYGIVDKFKSNVEQRRNSSSDLCQRLVHSKFLLSQDLGHATELIEREDQNIKAELTTYQKHLEEEPNRCGLTLGDFFGERHCNPFLDYISTPENIAFHYGLPILNSVVSSMDGYLQVQSGHGEMNHFDNRSPDGPYLEADRFQWEYGTSYIIYIPLKSRCQVVDMDYLDLISWPHSAEVCYRPYPFNLRDGILDNYSREGVARALWRQMSECFGQVPGEGQANIGEIDCEALVDGLCLDRLEAYEVLVKAIFLYLADPKSTVNHLALINIARPYDVIKLFRLFALFFDRVGNNKLLPQEKSLFLVDCEGKIDILFYGNKLSNIRKNISVSCLYGGITDTALKIISHLLEGRHE